MSEFPPKAKAKKQLPKKVEPVANVNAKRRRKPLGKSFRETFVQGDAKSAGSYVAQTVIVPMIRDLMYEAGQSLMQKMIFGDTRQRGHAPQTGGIFGRVDYTSVNNPTRAQQQATTSKSARARHSFDELVLDSRQGAEEVINRLMDILSQYEVVSVADLYTLVGFDAAHTDFKWGWTDLRGAGVSRTRTGGYLLDLPQPKALD